MLNEATANLVRDIVWASFFTYIVYCLHDYSVKRLEILRSRAWKKVQVIKEHEKEPNKDNIAYMMSRKVRNE